MTSFFRTIGFSLILAAAGQAPALTLEVTQNVKAESKGKTNDTKVQTRSLEAVVTSLQDAAVKVEVRWWFFARSLKTGKDVVFKKGNQTVTLEKLVPVTVASGDVHTTYVEEHAELEKAKGKGKKKGKDTKLKKVPASGERLTGYAVRVFSGGELLTEHLSAPAFKELLAGQSDTRQ